jgi:hypothetical protein
MGHVAWIGVMRSVYRILVVKPEGKMPFGRPGFMLQTDSIETNIK